MVQGWERKKKGNKIDEVLCVTVYSSEKGEIDGKRYQKDNERRETDW